MNELEYTGWDTVSVSGQTVEIELDEGKNFIYCLKLDSVDCGIFQIDYIDIRLTETLD